MQKITDYFLSGFINAPHFEKRKASYLFYILITALVYLLFVLFGQLAFGMSNAYLIGDAFALMGVMHSLWLFKHKRLEAAGHVLAAAAMLLLVIHNLVFDAFNNDPAQRYRIYITMVGLMGVLFIVISFFRDRRIVFIYCFAFETILLLHTLINYRQLRGQDLMQEYVIQHYTVAFTGVIAAAFISNWLLRYMDALFQQNVEDAHRIQLQNDTLEKLVAERTKALLSSNENLQEFAYIVSHDLKEPLRTISGFITLIKRQLDKQPTKDLENEEYLNFVVKGTVQMEHLINDILTYSKLNIVERHFEEINMDLLIATVKDSLSNSINETKASITYVNILNTQGEKHLIVQLFQNLISNALKYKNDNKPLTITIGSTEEPTRIRYFVEDNGIGINEQYYQTVFQAFKRLHSSAKYEGSGIGLAVCKKIVDIHGGEIWVESKEGKGSVFYFTLPKAEINVKPSLPLSTP